MQPGSLPAPLQLLAACAYGLAAIAFAILSGLLRSQRHARMLCAASAATALWAGAVPAGTLLAWQGTLAPGWLLSLAIVANLLETLHCAAWLGFLLPLLIRRIHTRQLLLGAVAAMAFLQLVPGMMVASRLLLAVLGMLLVEQWYRHTLAPQRWGIKFACLGIGAMFAFDFYLYSDAMLLRRVNPDIWAARGLILALSAPLLGVAAARNPAWSPALTLSRQLMFRSAALLGASAYLLAMAASAWYLRHVGGAWGALMQVSFLAGAALLLAGVLFSGTLRARLKVAINKHFYRTSFDYREEWLRFTRALSAEAPDIGVRSVQAIAELVESPAGALWVRRERGDFAPAASWNMASVGVHESGQGALCHFLEKRQWVIDLDACARDPHSYRQLELPGWLQQLACAWLVVPLMLQGRLFGFVLLTQPRTPLRLNWEVTDLLKIAGSQAAGFLAHRELADSLIVARQFESFNRMATFIVHDLKNLVLQLSLLLNNAHKHHDNPDFQRDMLGTLEHSVRKMTGLLQKLSRGETQEATAPLRLDQLLSEAVAARAAARPAPQLWIEASGLTVLADWSRLERVIGHIIQNAIEASSRDGQVVVRLLREAHCAVVELKDSGHGMSEQFIRDRLFKPFESTKATGMGIGAFESREYIHAVGGALEVASEEAVGTIFRVILPLHDASAVA